MLGAQVSAGHVLTRTRKTTPLPPPYPAVPRPSLPPGRARGQGLGALGEGAAGEPALFPGAGAGTVLSRPARLLSSPAPHPHPRPHLRQEAGLCGIHCAPASRPSQRRLADGVLIHFSPERSRREQGRRGGGCSLGPDSFLLVPKRGRGDTNCSRGAPRGPGDGGACQPAGRGKARLDGAPALSTFSALWLLSADLRDESGENPPLREPCSAPRKETVGDRIKHNS